MNTYNRHRIYKYLITKLKYFFGGHGLRENLIINWFLKTVKPKKIKIAGHTFFLNKNDTTISEIMISGSYEPEETELYKTIIRNGDVVIDVGANIGYFTLLFAKLAGPSGMVYTFEPDPVNFQLLQKNINANRYHNIKAFNFALSDSCRKGFLYLNDYNSGDHRIYGSEKDRKAVPIDIVALDDLLPNIKPSFIKIDTQGSEIGVLRGMKNILKNTRFLSVEYWPYGLNKTGKTGKDVENILIEYGFTYELNSDLYTIKNQKFTNILAVK